MTDVTAIFKDAVRRQRAALGAPTPPEEILRTKKPRSAFGEESHAAHVARPAQLFAIH